MNAVGVALLLSALGPAAPPDAVVLSGHRLARGEELHYLGEVTEWNERFGNRFRKQYALELRILVLEVADDYTDCAAMTTLRPLEDPAVLQGIRLTTGQKPIPPSPTIRLELIRVDDRGRVRQLTPAAGPPPLPLVANTATRQLPPIPLDVPTSLELGLFVPLPIGRAKLGSTWDVAEANRPPIGWNAKGQALWNGGRCIQLVATQQTDGWDRPETVREGWQRIDTILVPPADGYAATVQRVIRRREGRDDIGSLTIKYERQPTSRHVGGRYTDVRTEVETAWWFATDLAMLNMPGKAVAQADVDARIKRLKQDLEDSQTASGYRPAIEATHRRCETIALGTTPKVVQVTAYTMDGKPEPFALGKLAPDFVVSEVDRPTGRFRLATARGKPIVLTFFKPGSVTSKGALEIAEALHKHYSTRVVVVPLAAVTGIDAAATQRKQMKLTVPIFDGEEVRTTYEVKAYPQFLVIDSTGTACWEFEGCGEETGFLVKKELDRLLATGRQK